MGELRQALQAYHQILDLQNKFLDVEVSINLSRSVYTVPFCICMML